VRTGLYALRILSEDNGPTSIIVHSHINTKSKPTLDSPLTLLRRLPSIVVSGLDDITTRPRYISIVVNFIA